MVLHDTLLVAASANVDFLVRAAHVPAPGEALLGRAFAMFPGGKEALLRADGRDCPSGLDALAAYCGLV